MEARWMRRTFIGSLLSLPLLLASCVDSPVAPEASAPTLQPTITDRQYEVVRGEDGMAAMVSFVSDSEGGRVQFGPHSLTVPAGAVKSPTRFKAVLPFDDRLYVELSATSMGSPVENDVGSAGFEKPVRLMMSYSEATQSVNESTVTIAWLKDDGTLEPVSSWRDSSRKTVTADIGHFSGWVIADLERLNR